MTDEDAFHAALDANPADSTLRPFSKGKPTEEPERREEVAEGEVISETERSAT